jgi:hypothetical protein
MGDDRPIDHADFGELPSMIETVEQPHATSYQKWHDVQLQFIDKSSRGPAA